uniref:Uncharacterized protein n=1 Tax=Arundo donax TaxID=35708 RepID=A0A0A8Z5D2_ARUDO
MLETPLRSKLPETYSISISQNLIGTA